MLIIDGSLGEGGGQILRTSLSLAAITGTAVHFERIRAKRSKPGLMRQHLACVKAVSEICGGELEGAELKSQEMIFRPGKIRGGEYRFVIGSAGNTLLLAQAVLPLLLFAEEPSTVVLEGGTYNTTDCPSYDFFERVFLPCLSRMGAEVAARLERPGFCPAGGGRVVLSVKPARAWRRLALFERGKLLEARVTALGSGLETAILDDELSCFQAGLAGLADFKSEARMVESPGTGNFLMAELKYNNLTELFGVCGSYGVSRWAVAKRVAGLTRKYLKNKWVVGPYLADQLLLPMTLGAGGFFLTGNPTLHSETNREIIRRFMDVKIEFTQLDKGLFKMEVEK